MAPGRPARWRRQRRHGPDRRGAPGNNIGADGDYYLDTTTWTLYGPKANGQWPAGVALAGQPGSGGGGTGGTGGGTPVGNGNHVLYGTGAPTDSVGVDGDFYYDTSTGTLYGPKAGGHWPTTGATVPTVYNGNFNVPDTLSRGKYVMTGAGGAVPLPSDFGVVIPYDCTHITLTAHTLGKATGTLNMAVYKITGSGASATTAAVGNLSCKISNGQQDCSKDMPAAPSATTTSCRYSLTPTRQLPGADSTSTWPARSRARSNLGAHGERRQDAKPVAAAPLRNSPRWLLLQPPALRWE